MSPRRSPLVPKDYNGVVKQEKENKGWPRCYKTMSGKACLKCQDRCLKWWHKRCFDATLHYRADEAKARSRDGQLLCAASVVELEENAENPATLLLPDMEAAPNANASAGLELSYLRTSSGVSFKSAFSASVSSASTNDEFTAERQYLGYINNLMSSILRVKTIVKLRDKYMARLIVHAFYRVDKCKELWRRCESPLMAALLVECISKKLIEKFDERYDIRMATLFKAQKSNFSNLAYRLLESTLIEMAHECKDENFLGHVLCQDAMNDRWKPGFRCSRLGFFMVYIFSSIFFWLPLILHPCGFFFEQEISMNDENEEENQSWLERLKKYWVKQIKNGPHRWWCFVTSPCFRFALYMTGYVTYLSYFIWLLLGIHEVKNLQGELTRKRWMLFSLWQMFYLVDIFCQYLSFSQRKRLSKPGSHANGLYKFFWKDRAYTTLMLGLMVVSYLFVCLVLLLSSMDFLSFGSESKKLAAIFEIIKFYALLFYEVFFFLNFIFAALWTLRVLTVFPKLSAIVMTIKKMLELSANFLLVSLFFWVAYGLCQVSLRGINSESSIQWSLFSNGAFEIFGELDEKVKNGEVNCTMPLSWITFQANELQCAFRQWMIPVFLFLYTIITSVLIVNILTVLIGQYYKKVVSTEQWRILWYERIVDNEDKLFFPPPLTLLNIFIYVPLWLYRKRYCSPKKRPDTDTTPFSIYW
ncbi:unnamed protein product, partial [Mesorhabditis belari]|uniref:Ion transport domain-containing protein n=1 Tax=Mesorhabditis belari TaxID=2138241 RepID=A0AAF3FAL8_9BILA